jgi:hypothetical protein
MTSSQLPSGRHIKSSMFQLQKKKTEIHPPTVVPAECIVYFSPLAFSSLCTAATSSATDNFPVPTYLG